MDRINVLVTGGRGQLAKTIKHLFNNGQGVTNYTVKDKESLDITDNKSILNALSENEYSYVVNCAAYTDVDGAETNKELAFFINSTSVGNLAKICKDKNIVLIHVSTDYVFDGNSTKPYKENDPTNPINIYGASKLSGEKLVKENINRYFILRTSWLYSCYGKNFVKTIISKIKQDKELKIITSQVGAPTSCIQLAYFIDELISKNVQKYGTYHVTALGKTNWYGFAKHISSHFTNYESEKLQPIADYPAKAKRPAYSVLDNTKASTILPAKDWRSNLDLVINKIG